MTLHTVYCVAPLVAIALVLFHACTYVGKPFTNLIPTLAYSCFQAFPRSVLCTYHCPYLSQVCTIFAPHVLVRLLSHLRTRLPMCNTSHGQSPHQRTALHAHPHSFTPSLNSIPCYGPCNPRSIYPRPFALSRSSLITRSLTLSPGELVAHQYSVNCVHLSREAEGLLVTGGDDKKVHVWGLRDPVPVLVSGVGGV